MLDNESDLFVRRLHDVYHAPPTAPIHPAQNGPVRTPDHDAGFRFLFKDAQPGTPQFNAQHLVGSASPEPYIERWDGIGSEDLGPVELIDGRTGQSIVRVNRHARKHLDVEP